METGTGHSRARLRLLNFRTNLKTKPVMTSNNIKKGSNNPSFGVIEGDFSKGLLIVSDHAHNTVPARYNNLGLSASEFERHIAYDIGAQDLTVKLAEQLDVPAVYSKFSRLLIDPNRGTDDPTLIMKISDGALVPGNIDIDEQERQWRIATYYQPYHDAIENMIARAIDEGCPPMIFSVHSFTPYWKGVPRPWHVGVLWEEDDRFARPLIEGLTQDKSLIVGENEPYAGGVPGESMEQHARNRGLAAALIEVRQDLICDQTGVDEWSERLAQILSQITV